jgi:hypothetical protein
MRLVGKKNSTFGLEMRLKMSDQSCTYNSHHVHIKQNKSQAIFTVLGHVVEAQCLPKNPANSTFTTGKTIYFS